MGLVGRVLAGIERRIYDAKAGYAVKAESQVIHGPARVVLGAADCAVISLMKDAGYYIDQFIAHHQALGAKHIVIIDNGSTDDTVTIARSYTGVTVVQNTLPAKDYECLLRSRIARQVCKGGWLLFVDSDELFEVPCGKGAALPRLVQYLEMQGYTAMVTQMLDLFSPLPYGVTKAMSYAETLTGFNRYSLDHMTAIPYHDKTTIGFSWFLQENTCEYGAVRLQIGGLRREVFVEDCFLSKHSLVKNQHGINLMPHPHCASGVKVADVTGLLRHYKLAGDYLDRDRRSVALGTWDHAEDAKRLEAAVAGDDFVIAPKNDMTFRGVDDLLEQGFLVASSRYRAFMNT